MKSVILVTGASTGIGHLTARALAAEGQQAVADEIARIVGLPADRRPFRSLIDFIDDGAAAVSEVAERVREEFAERIGIADLLRPAIRA